MKNFFRVKKNLRLLLFSVICCIGVSANTYSYVPPGDMVRIYGIVTDEAGVPVDSATVAFTSGENTVSALTDSVGRYSVKWRPDVIIQYVDGVERHRSTRGIHHIEMYMLVNLAVGGDWPGSPDESTPFPSFFEVEYVRVYEER